jgi:adenylosuccinate synthase
MRYATRVNGLTSVAVTKLDVLDGCKELKVCTGYRYQGQTFREMPADLEALSSCEPLYKTFKGWSASTTGVTTYKGLPAEAKRYLQFIEDHAECPIDMISTGSKRDATIILKNPIKQPARQKSR